ncbi:MAG: class I tRNA ligase family protein [Planctomycetes bacterium]|nr:class I tRNA ligase family protein [Planctomycetota bacterium]
MQTGTQDIRLPVQAISPFTGNPIDLAKAKHGRGIFSYLCPESGREFDVLGSLPGVPAAKLVSSRFDEGRNFANKLWNAARFALLNLEGADFEPRDPRELAEEDRWILSRLARAAAEVQAQLEAYNPSAAIGAARDFFWSELCDWYLEIVKPRLKDAASARAARQVLAVAIDHVLRLLHPFVPFITEALWQRLGAQVPVRGIEAPLATPALLIAAPWPAPPERWIDQAIEEQFRFVQEITRAIREIRNKYKLAPGVKLTVRVRAAGPRAAVIEAARPLLSGLAGIAALDVAPDAARTADSATAVIRDVEVYVLGAVNIEEEKGRLGKQRARLAAQVESLEQKLANENFRTRAAAAVVASETTRLAELKTELSTVEQTLATL